MEGALGYSDDKLQVIGACIPPTLKTDEKKKGVKTVIDDLVTPEIFFSAKRLYYINIYRRDKMEKYDHVERDEYTHRLSTYMQ